MLYRYRAVREDGVDYAILLETARSPLSFFELVHLLALVPSEDFDRVVERILEGSRVNLASNDRFQLAMLVVDRLDGLLPLPPFEVWVEDFLAHRERYRLYAETLHRAGRLP